MNRERIAASFLLVPLLLLGGLLAWYRRAAVPGAGEPGVIALTLTGVAADGVWTFSEVNGLNYWWKTFEPATLFLREGDEVVLNLKSADLFHRFYLPAFGVGPVDVEPGHLATVRFRAAKAGVYQYFCTSMCGSCHFYMRGWVVVTAPGATPVRPPPILCRFCRLETGPPPDASDLVALGSYLYLGRGCVTCHGPEGRGGVVNLNAANDPVPAHDSTASKLFLGSPEDARAFLDLLQHTADLNATEDVEIARFPIVRARFENARDIVRLGRYSAKLDPEGSEPPLQMPAWQHLVSEREIDALLAYFVSLERWEDGDGPS